MKSFSEWLESKDFKLWFESTSISFTDEGALASRLVAALNLTNYLDDQYFADNPDYAKKVTKILNTLEEMIDSMSSKTQTIEKFTKRRPVFEGGSVREYIQKLGDFFAHRLLRGNLRDRHQKDAFDFRIKELEKIFIQPTREKISKTPPPPIKIPSRTRFTLFGT